MATPRAVADLLRAPVAEVSARVLLTCAFWWSGITKTLDFPGAVREVAGLTGVGPGLAEAGAVLTILVQIVGSALVIAGRAAWLGAAALAGFTLVATVLAHGFWSFEGAERGRQLTTFLEHLGLIGGLLLAASLAERRR